MRRRKKEEEERDAHALDLLLGVRRLRLVPVVDELVADRERRGLEQSELVDVERLAREGELDMARDLGVDGLDVVGELLLVGLERVLPGRLVAGEDLQEGEASQLSEGGVGSRRRRRRREGSAPR